MISHREQRATADGRGRDHRHAEYLGPLTRVGLDAAAWQEVPARVVVDDRVVHLDSFPVGDDTVLITRGDHDHFALLVVPPHATADAALVTRARAIDAQNVTSAAQILVAPVPGIAESTR